MKLKNSPLYIAFLAVLAATLLLFVDVIAGTFVIADPQVTNIKVEMAENHTTELFVTITIVVSVIVFFLRRQLVRHHDFVRKVTEESSNQLSVNNYAEPYIQKCMIIINARFKEDLQLEEVAKVLNISSPHLQQMLFDLTNKSFVEHLNEVRVAYAKKLLIKSDKEVSEVSKAVGYDNKHYFIRLFKNEYGMSPEKFKSSYS
ncbi:helix-turn-helix transcriptional regulator [Reichenbachiella versicolor]|uniref:helix-turn-helix transcriptional regulator n=1 Tax=Reichenbachiella versicolor TaxID=1821036 RepID=UPI000D6E2516|nr:AraC family transcriptional regulator [Reichenbachiella versicolor]